MAVENRQLSRWKAVSAWVWVALAALLAIGGLTDRLYVMAVLMILSAALAAPPLREVWAKYMPVRSIGWTSAAVGVAGMVALGATAPTPASLQKQGSVAVAKSEAAERAPAATRSPQPQSLPATLDDAGDVLLVIRQTIMPVIGCSGDIEQLRAAADKVATGRGTAMDAYSAAHLAERDCRKQVAEAGDYNPRPFKATKLNSIYERTLPACQAVSSQGAKAASIAKELLDGEASLKKGQQFRDMHAAMEQKITECKLGLQGVAEAGGLPPSKVDFLGL